MLLLHEHRAPILTDVLGNRGLPIDTQHKLHDSAANIPVVLLSQGTKVLRHLAVIVEPLPQPILRDGAELHTLRWPDLRASTVCSITIKARRQKNASHNTRGRYDITSHKTIRTIFGFKLPERKNDRRTFRPKLSSLDI
jgi:hypothetical protein